MSGQAAHRPGDAAVARLTKRPEFLAARKGERRKGPFFLLEVLERGDAGAPRVGYTVTKKQGNAVERNRMRRRLKAAVRLTARFAMQPGHDYVIVARRDALGAPFSRLTSALKDRIEGPKSRPASKSGRKAGGDAAAQNKSRAEQTVGDAPERASDRTPGRSSRIRDGQ